MPQSIRVALFPNEVEMRALPEAGSGEAWWDVMGLAGSSVSREAIEANYWRLAKTHHPDAGGDPEFWFGIQRAYEQALAGRKAG